MRLKSRWIETYERSQNISKIQSQFCLFLIHVAFFHLFNFYSLNVIICNEFLKSSISRVKTILVKYIFKYMLQISFSKTETNL